MKAQRAQSRKSRLLRPGLVVAACLAGLTGATSEELPHWTSAGPEGGLILAAAAAPDQPSRIYAAGNGGVFRSVDAGTSWTAIAEGLEPAAPNPSLVAYTVAVKPDEPSTVLTALYYG